MSQFTELFRPARLRGLTLRNRIIMPSMLTQFASAGGEVSDRLVAYYAERAKGGAGLVIPEATAVDDSGLSYFPGLSIAHDRFIRGLRKLTDAVHAHGARIAAQLGHAGPYARPELSRSPRPLVSFVPGWSPLEDARVLDSEEIERLAGSFAAAAERAAAAGFDMVEVHGAHGYLIGSFLSPFTNRRTDEWGGSFEKRMRFPKMIIEGIRGRLGADFPISFRLSSDEFIEGGIRLPLAVEIAREVVKSGVDLVHVSTGMIETNRFTGPPPALPMGWNAAAAEAIRSALSGSGALVTVAGRIHDGETAEEMLRAGKTDFVSMGRALIADPALPKKLAAGRERTVKPCLSCNEGCIGNIAQRKPLSCAVNPAVGLEQMPCRPVGRPKNVVVVGAGVAGMEAALTAARKGHEVTLFERSNRPGGLVNVAALPPHKDILSRLVEYYSHELVENGVRLVFGSSPSAAELKALQPDALFVATGSQPLVPGFLRSAPAISAAEVLSGAPVGRRVLVLGGGLVGAETAEFLAAQGKDVAVLELREHIAADMQSRARAFLMEALAARHVDIMSGLEIVAVSGEGRVTVKDRYGNQYRLEPYDTLVMALGYRSDAALSADLAREGVPFVPIGDCVQAGRIMDAVHQAFNAASAV